MNNTNILIAIVCLLFAACTKDKIQDAGQNTALSITVSVNRFDGMPATRATDAGYTTSFEVGDAIGIYAFNGTSEVYVNKKWIYNGTAWKPATEADNIYYSAMALELNAYYPYNAGASALPTAANFTVLPDQSVAGAYRASDLLFAQNTWTGSREDLALTFSHEMTMVEVYPSLPVKMQSITLKAAPVSGGTPTTVTFAPAENGSFRALLPAQTLAGNIDLKYKTGENYIFPVSGKTLAAGAYHKFIITGRSRLYPNEVLEQTDTMWKQIFINGPLRTEFNNMGYLLDSARLGQSPFFECGYSTTAFTSPSQYLHIYTEKIGESYFMSYTPVVGTKDIIAIRYEGNDDGSYDSPSKYWKYTERLVRAFAQYSPYTVAVDNIDNPKIMTFKSTIDNTATFVIEKSE